MLWTDEGSRLASHILDAEVAASDHFHVECAAALRRLELGGELTRHDAQAALDQLFAPRLRRVNTAPLLREAWSMRHDVTVADALYVAVARRLEVTRYRRPAVGSSSRAGHRRTHFVIATVAIADLQP